MQGGKWTVNRKGDEGESGMAIAETLDDYRRWRQGEAGCGWWAYG